MSDKPSISVIISMYNERQLVSSAVEQALTSIGKTFESFELILIDDGSTDGTRNILHKISETDDRIVFIDNIVNLNLGLSLKRGFAAAKGEVVLYNSIDLPLDCDDIAILIEEMGNADVLVIQRDAYPGATLWRRFISIGNRLFMKLLFPIATRRLWDMNYVQFFKQAALQSIMPLSCSPTFTPIEMIIRAHRAGMNIRTTVAAYHRRNSGKGAFGKPHDILWTIYEAIRFRLRHD